jgi:hypothetical protein
MTGPRESHLRFEELISASLKGDLTAEERRRLDAHLDGCAACRATLAAFSDQRRVMAGLRHVAPPRDLGARVRTGVEQGRFAAVPWWRRPATLFAGVGGGLAVVAGALLALVLLTPSEPQVGDASPTPTAASPAASPTPLPTFPSGPTPAPTVTASPAPEPTEGEPTPTPDPSPEPDLYLAWTGPFDNRALTVRHGLTGDTLFEVDTPSGPPVVAELSPDGQWLAYVTPVGESGVHEVRATRVAEGVPSDDPDALPPVDSPVAVGETVMLGESISGDAFVERLFWAAPRGGHLAYTLTDPETGATDVWIFEPGLAEPYRLTDAGNAYAASWIPGGGAGSSLLWVSVAGDRPVSYLWYLHDSAMGPDGEPIDPASEPMATAEGVFQPLLSPNGRFAIYWDGAMERSGDGWIFASGGQPYLAEHVVDGEDFGFNSDSVRPVFTDLSVGRDGFTSASVTWSLDGDAYAVWNARWTGTPQSGTGEAPYPDETRVYFSRATDERGMTRVHAIDRDDIPDGWNVVDVKVAPTGEHLLVTVVRPAGGVLEAPAAVLLMIERNTGDEPDAVTPLTPVDDGFWYGPAAFDGFWGTADRP